jgi:hypothetical protein
MYNAKQSQTNTLYQQEDNMAWLVRHCSPLLYIHTAAYADWSRNKSNSTRQCDRCASMDRGGVRVKIHNR